MNLKNVENSGVKKEILESLSIDSRHTKCLLRVVSNFCLQASGAEEARIRGLRKD